MNNDKIQGIRSQISVSLLIQRLSPVFILAALIIFMTIATGDFFRPAVFNMILRQTAMVGVVSIGMTMVILTAGIDLSVGSLMAFSAAIMGVAATRWGIPPLPAIVLGFAAGAFLGFVNGVVITKGKIQPFIATLGMMIAARGLVLLIMGRETIRGIPESMFVIGGGRFDFGGGIPYSAVVFAIVAIVAWVLVNKTTFGRNIMAIGGNAEASRTSGIPVDRTKIWVYGLTGLFCAIAGFLYMGRTTTVHPRMATGFELQAITAVVLGGTSLSGGFGSIVGTVIGVFTIGVLNVGLNLMGVQTDLQEAILGGIIIVVVILDSWRKRKFD